MLGSIVCRYDHFLTEWYAKWAPELGLDQPSEADPESPRRNIHRKVWEWCAISQALHERDMLRPGRSGCGFAVGREPLPSLFAAYGVDVLATDAPPDAGSSTWEETGQYAASLDALHTPRLVGRAEFDRRVSFRPADMRDLRDLPFEAFDFVWSSCSFEHLGTLEAGLEFVEAANRLLKPGGVAVHTTEYNVSSNDATLTTGPQVIYRRRDIEELDRRLRLRRCGLARLDLDPGDHRYDLDYDIPPYHVGGRKHVKLVIDDFVATSVLLIVRKGASASHPGSSPSHAG